MLMPVPSPQFLMEVKDEVCPPRARRYSHFSGCWAVAVLLGSFPHMVRSLVADTG